MRNIFLIGLLSLTLFNCTDFKDKNGMNQTVHKDSKLVLNSSVNNLTDSIQIKNIQIGSESPDEKNRLHLSYPSTHFEFINKIEEDFVQAYLAEFKKNARDINDTAVSGVDFGQHFEVIEHTPNLMAFFIDRYTSYGNNYDEQFYTHLYDLKLKKVLKFSDLFNSQNEFKEFVQIIRLKTENILKQKINNMNGLTEKDRITMWGNMTELFDDGIASNDQNYDAFSWDKDGNMTIYFDKYQLASGNFGSIKVTVKPEDYRSFINNKYHRLFHFTKVVEVPVSVVENQTSSKSGVDCGKVPCIALTFDDGPSVYTSRLLDILKENKVKATFFVLGKSAKVQKNTLLRTFQEGHQIGNHSWDHKDLKKLSKESIEQQIYDTNDVIKSITGVAPHVMRPPYGSFNPTVTATAKMPIILWNLDPLDWKDRNSSLIVDRISKATPKGIVLAHDIHKTTVEAIPAVIKALKAKGYHLVTIDELFAGTPLKAGEVYRQRK